MNPKESFIMDKILVRNSIHADQHILTGGVYDAGENSHHR